MSLLKKLFNTTNHKKFDKLSNREEFQELDKLFEETNLDLQKNIQSTLIEALKSDNKKFINYLLSKNLDFPSHIDNNSILSYAILINSNLEIIETIINEETLSKDYAYGLTPFEMALEVNAEFKLFSILIDNNILHHSESKLSVLHQLLDNENIEDTIEGAIIAYLLEQYPNINLNEEFQNTKPLTVKAYEQDKLLLLYVFLSYGAKIKDVYNEYDEAFDTDEKLNLSQRLLENQPKEDYEYFLPFLAYEDFENYLNNLDSTKDMQILLLITKNFLLNLDGKIELCKIALKKGCDVNELSNDTEELTPLQFYCKNYLIGKNLSFIDFLFENGAIFNYNNNSAITTCVSGNELDLIIYLVEKRAIDINELNKEGEGAINGFFDPVYLKTNEDKITMFETLVSLGLDINQKVKGRDTDEYPNTSLIDVLLHEEVNHQLLEYILHNHPEIKVENQISTMFKNNPSDNLCALMISKNPHYCDDSFYTKTLENKEYQYSARPIDLAIHFDKVELTNYLLDEYPDMQAYNEGFSIISKAYNMNFPLETIKKLIDRDTDLNRLYYDEDRYGILLTETTLIRIMRYTTKKEEYESQDEIVRYLIKKGANTNIPLTKLNIDDIYLNEEGAVIYALNNDLDTNILDILIDEGNLDPKKQTSNLNQSQIHSLLISRQLDDEEKLFYLKYFNKKCGLNLEEKNKNGYNLFLYAVSNCLAKCVEFLIELGSDVHIIGGSDNSPAIHKAISNHYFVDKTKRAHTVEILIKAGVDLEQFDSEQLTPLMSAVKYGCFESVLKLLEHKVDVNNKNELGCNAANVLITNDFENTEHKYSYDDIENIEENKSKILAVLKDYDCDLDNVPLEGSTILCNAIGFNLKTIFNTLLQLDIDINKKDVKGINPLMVAITFADIYFVNTLLQHSSIDLLVEDNSGENLIYKAIRRENDQKMLDLIGYLIDNNVPIKTLENGMNLLIFASYFCHYRLYEGLLEFVQDINEKDTYGLNALFWTIQSNIQIPEQERMISINKLIELGANVQDLDSSGKNLLHWAVICHFELIFDMLFKNHSLDINLKDSNGYTPICYFITNYFDKAYEGYEDFFKNYISKVVEHGANINDAITLAKSIDENCDIIPFLESF